MSHDYLKSKCVMIQLPPKTRWFYNYKMVNSLIENQSDIKIACEMIKIDYLTIQEISDAQHFLKVTVLVKSLIELFEKNYESTISKCIPKLISCRNKLMKLIKPESKYASNLIKDIALRLESILNPSASDFNVVYSLASYLDNNTNKLMSSADLVIYKNLAEKYIGEKLIFESIPQNVDFGDYELGLDVSSNVDGNSELKM